MLATDRLHHCKWVAPSIETKRITGPLELLRCARSSTDRASDYGSEGWGFESLRAREKSAGQGPGRHLRQILGLRICHGFVTEARVNGLRRVVDLDLERTRRFSAEIERELRRSGARTLVAATDGVEDLGRWRRAAVMAAHRMGHRARTYIWGREVALELDLPVSEAEDRLAAELVASLLDIGRHRS